MADQPYSNAHRAFTEGDTATARRFCQEIIAERPNAWPPHLLLARIMVSTGETELVRDHIAAAQEAGAPLLNLTRVLELEASASGDADSQIRHLETLHTLEPESSNWLKRLARVCLDAGRFEDVFEFLNKLLELSPETDIDPAIIQQLMQQLEPEDFVRRISILVDAHPENWLLRTTRATALATFQDMTAALQDIEAACKIDPDRTFSGRLLSAFGTRIDKDNQHWQRLENLFQANPRCASLLWFLAKILDRSGEVDRARALVKENWTWAVNKNPPPKYSLSMLTVHNSSLVEHELSGRKLYYFLLKENRIQEALEVTENAYEKGFLQQVLAIVDPAFPPIGVSDYSAEITVAGPERSNGTVLVFTGIADRAAFPTHLLDYFFAELGLTAIYLRDFSRLLYLNGLRSLGGSLEASLQEISSRVQSMGAAKPLFTFGNSAGGMAAIVYAEALGARASVVFSPPSTINPAHHDMMGDERQRIIFKRLMSVLDHERFDLQTILQRAPENYLVTAFAGAESREDRAHAERLAAMPKTKVHILDDIDGHNSLAPATNQLGFLNILRDSFNL